jgi:hypothetical protein
MPVVTEYKRRPVHAPNQCCATARSTGRRCSAAPRFVVNAADVGGNQEWFCKHHVPETARDLCAICLEECDTVKTDCGHPFHAKCIGVWLQTHNTCPICRGELHKPSQDPHHSEYHELIELRARIGISVHGIVHDSGYVEIDPLQYHALVDDPEVQTRMRLSKTYPWASDPCLVHVLKQEYYHIWYAIVNTCLWDAHHVIFGNAGEEECCKLLESRVKLRSLIHSFTVRFNLDIV